MARWAVGSVPQSTQFTTHDLGSLPVLALTLGSVSSAQDSTVAAAAGFGIGFSRTTLASFQRVGGWCAAFSNSSARTTSDINSSHGAARYTTAAVMLPTTVTVQSSAQFGYLSSNGVQPSGFALVGGDEVNVDSDPTTFVSTVAGSTQGSTGYNFQPKAALVFGQTQASSIHAFSLGFACVDTAGARSQWSVSQVSREAGNAHSHRSASTESAIKLHTTASTSHDVAITSFYSTGIELTVNATDTARPAIISVLGLNVPKADAGKATITTNGAGTGQTGFTVSGIGQNVGLCIFASIGSSLQTLQAHNMFSIGFASSNGNQRAVSGFVTDGGGASTRYASYFGTSHAVIFVSGSTNVHPLTAAGVNSTAPPFVISKGVFALDTASSGFKVTFDSTVVNGWDVYWAALSNVVADIGASIQSSFNANAGPKEVGHIGGAVASSFNVNAGPKPLQGIGAAIQAAFTEALGLTPDFIPGEGKIRAHSQMETRIEQDASIGLGRGQHEEDSDRYRVFQENTSSPDRVFSLDVTTERTRLGIAELGNAKFLRILPPSTNTVPLRLAAGRSGDGMPLGQGMSAFTIADRGGSDAYLFTTSTGSTIHDVRVLIE